MKRLHLELIALAAVVILALGALSIAQQPAQPESGAVKLAYFDFQKILDESVEGKKAQAALEKKFGDVKETLKKKGEELKQLQEEIEKKKDIWTPEIRQEKMAIFEAKYRSYLQQKMVLQEQYNNEFIKLVSPMQKEINEIVQAIGKEKKLTMIFKFDVSARSEESSLVQL